MDKIIEGADIFVGVSAAGALTTEMASKMTEKNLVLAMANPIPEIMPEEAKKVIKSLISFIIIYVFIFLNG